MTQNNSFILGLVLLIGVIAGTYYFTGQYKDQYYKNNTTHIRDTTIIHDSIPQPPRIIYIDVPYSVKDTVASDSAYSKITKEEFRRITAKVDTLIKQDTVAVSHIQYNPLTRVLVYGLQLSPIPKTTIKIRDSIITPYPVIEHDSWVTRVAILTIGGLIVALVK
jgi:hypothetical protein